MKSSLSCSTSSTDRGISTASSSSSSVTDQFAISPQELATTPSDHTASAARQLPPPYPIPSQPITHPYSPLYLSYSPSSGRSVFCKDALPPNQVIEISPILVLPESDTRNTVLNQYTYSIPMRDHNRDNKIVPGQAIALGYGSLFNHSRNPNVMWALDKREGVIRYTTKRAVSQDEQLTIWYGDDVSWIGVEDTNTCNNNTEEQGNSSGSLDQVLGKFCSISWD